MISPDGEAAGEGVVHAELRRRVATAGERFRLLGGGADLEVACDIELRGRMSRGRLRLSDYGDGKLAVIFFRTAAAGGGTYGYGGLAVRSDRVRGEQIDGWLEYLGSGFDWGCRPRGLQRAFQFGVRDQEVVE